MATTKKKSEAQLEFESEQSALSQVASSSRNKKPVSSTTMFKAQQELEKKIAENEGDTFWIYNNSGTEYHLPPVSTEPKDASTAIIFDVAATNAFKKEQIDVPAFRKAFIEGRLEIVTRAQAEKLEAGRMKALESSSSDSYDGKTKKAGLHSSGLPQNISQAMAYVWACEDVDELEQLLQAEDRDKVQDAIEARMEDLEEAQR